MVDSPIAESIEYRPPTQSQNPNMFAVSMPNLATRSALVDTATKCLATASSAPRADHDPVPGRRRVGQRLQRAERLGGDDEQRLVRVQVPGGLDEVGGVHVGHEPERDVPRRVVPQRLVRHHRAQVRAADAHVDDVANPLAGVAPPLPGPDPVREVRHPVQHLVHLPHHVGAVHDQRCGPRHAQRHVQHGPVLGHVDVLAAEHGVPPLRHAGLAGQLDQQPHGLVGDPVLGVVQVEPGRLRGQPLAPPGIRGEQLPQVLPGDLGVVPLELLPRLPLTQRCHRHVLPPISHLPHGIVSCPPGDPPSPRR